MSASDKPRLAGRQPSYRGGVPRVKTWPVDATRRAGKRGEPLSRTDPSVRRARRGPGHRHERGRVEHPMTDSPNWSFETKQIHAGQVRRQRHRRPGAADLPDDELRLQRHRPRREPVRAQGVRQHLHPAHEPDDRRRRAAHRGARGWRRRPARRLGPGRRDARHPQHRRGGRPRRRLTLASTAAPSTC